ncbi:MAG: aminotransferase class I/II-fold pyridoxal phosphate-dependent enzyme, partial [Phycisphaerae bacterium]|nr:aminotransferase class I/II-fold pyridoxal phosphate-dependent enzyme [Phycisphaerae bacterium]
MTTTVQNLQSELDALQSRGTCKEFVSIAGPMGPVVRLSDGREVINLCSNNYLGLANHPEVIRGAKEAIDQYGFGTSSVRFICGTLAIHQKLEEALGDF